MIWVWRVIWLVSLPGVALHELTHAAVAWRWADVSIEWRDDTPWYLEPALRVRMENWAVDAPTWAMLGAYLGPLIIGYAAAGVGVWIVLSDVTIALSPVLVVTIGINWLYYTGASVADLAPIVSAID